MGTFISTALQSNEEGSLAWSSLNRLAAIMPFAFSALACLIAVGNILAGVPPQPDEGAAAHVWQLLMAAQLPLMILFAATSHWRGKNAAIVLGAQFLAFGLACAPVFLAGY